MNSSTPTPADVLGVFDTFGSPGTPFTTLEVAEHFDCTDRTVYNKLDALVEEGHLETKKVGARGRVWWRPVRQSTPNGGEVDGETPETALAERYRSLFEEMDEGFALCELVRDAEGQAYDIRYVELNEAFEDLTGVSRTDAEGRLAGEVFPRQDDSFFESYERVAETGEPEHVENYVPANGRWYEVRIFPREGDLFAVLYDDITERKERNRRDQFMLELSDQMRDQEDQDAMGKVCTRLLADELGLDRSYFVRFFPDEEEALVGPEFHSSGLDPVSGLYPFSTFPEAIQQIQTETPVYDDVANDSTLPEGERQALLELGFGAWVGAPIRREVGNADWALYAVYSEPHNWTVSEVSLVEEAAERTWTSVERARAEQAANQSNQSLKRLNDASRELIDADPETISNRVAELTLDILDVEYAAHWRYDNQIGDIELHSEHSVPETNLSAVRPSEVSREHVWETFIGDDIDVENALDITDSDSSPSQLGSRVSVPLGRHGVIVAGSVHSETFDERRVDLVKMIASTVETAWNRAESERELTRQNEELARLDRLNTLIRSIDQALVEAETVEEIDGAVCDRLTESALYEFAWIGDFDADTDAVRPRAWAGIDSSTLEALTSIGGDRTPDEDPYSSALRTREVQVVADIATDIRAPSWREAALERGARACLCIPLVYEESIYGVVVVYLGQPVHTNRDTKVLTELGTTVAYAINAVETRKTFQADSVVELTLRSTTADSPLCRLSRATDSEIEFDGLVSGDDGEATVFFTATGATADELLIASEDLLSVTELEYLVTRESSGLFKIRVSEPVLASHVLDRDATVRSLRIDAGTATVVVELPGSADVRKFVHGLGRAVPDLELLSRHTRTRETEQTLQAAVLGRLTPRQQEVLHLAYRSGYFESPRIQTGEELADTLGIVPSTFTRHIREAQRNLLNTVFATGER